MRFNFIYTFFDFLSLCSRFMSNAMEFRIHNLENKREGKEIPLFPDLKGLD